MDLANIFNRDTLSGDLSLEGADLAADSGLETAVVISLFTDRRAQTDDPLPQGEADRRGWWGDALPPEPALRIGSRLWLLRREKITAETVERAREYAIEALQWLIDLGVAERVEVLAEAQAPDRLALSAVIHRPEGDAVRFRYDRLWEAA